MRKVLKILFNFNRYNIGHKAHCAFLKAQGDNIAFLLSRITVLLPDTREYSKASLFYLKKNAHLIDQTSPALFLSHFELRKKFYLEPSNAYTTEFPKAILSKSFYIATRVLVWRGLAVWAFYEKDEQQLAKVVNVGINRIILQSKPQLQMNNRNQLKSFSKEWFYFVSHVILIATMWGELEVPVGGTVTLWKLLSTMLKKWATNLRPVAKENIEVWVELLLCLRLLSWHQTCKEFAHDEIKLFNIKLGFIDQNHYYHTYVLLGLLWALRMRSKAKYELAGNDDDKSGA